MEDPFLTVPRIAAELEVNEVTVRAWIRSGRLNGIRAGRTYRVRRSDLDEMLRIRLEGEAAAPPAPRAPVDFEDLRLAVRVRRTETSK